MQADLMLTTRRSAWHWPGSAGAARAPTVGALTFFVHSLRRNRTMMGRALIAGGVTAALMSVCDHSGSFNVPGATP